MERFLYRLSQSRHADTFILKGALMLVVWAAPLSRPTMDIDLLGYTGNTVETIVAIMQEVCGQEVEPDGVIFEAATVTGRHIIEDADYEGVRVRFQGKLGTARIPMQLDIGCGCDFSFPEPGCSQRYWRIPISDVLEGAGTMARMTQDR